MTKKKLPKINRDSGKGATGYQWDNGNIAFGSALDAIERREFMKNYDKEYRQMYKKPVKPKSRKKIILKNELL
jgi:hypothetical protein